MKLVIIFIVSFLVTSCAMLPSLSTDINGCEYKKTTSESGQVKRELVCPERG